MRPNRLAGFFLISTGIAIILVMAGVWYLWSDGVFESEDEQIKKLTSAIIPDSSTVYDRNNEKIGEYYNVYHIFVPYDEIPKPMINSLLAIEDRRFFEHSGVNWRSLGRAILASVSSGRMAQGGSTITMQLIKNYLLTREKKVSRKIRELILAYYVEKNLSKERILELYLNTMYMGHGAYGVGAASQTYFGAKLQDLEPAEFALLAGLFQAPSAYDPHKRPDLAIKRQQTVIDALVAAKYITPKEAQEMKDVKLVFQSFTPINQTVAPYYLGWIRELVAEILGDEGETINDRGMRIYTTLDKELQIAANKAMATADPKLEAFQTSMKLRAGDRLEAAMIATNPADGAVLAMVGGRNFKKSQYNRATRALRSPGSAFKPVVYSLAMDQGMHWSDLVFVSPIDIGGYRPKNHDGDDMTEVTLIKALARSMNTPVISLAQKFGIENVMERGKAMGVESDMPREIGIAIGGFSSSLLDMNRLYGTIANDGKLAKTWTITKITDRENNVLYDAETFRTEPTEAITAQTAALVRSGLQGVLTNGTGAAAADLATLAAGKTGTSNDSRDNWFCGFTKNLVTVVWVGSDGNAPLGRSAAGSSLALPIWNEFMHDAVGGIRPTDPWGIPDSLSSITIDPDYGTPAETGVTVLFPKGKEPKASQASEDIKTIQKDSTTYRGTKLDE